LRLIQYRLGCTQGRLALGFIGLILIFVGDVESHLPVGKLNAMRLEQFPNAGINELAYNELISRLGHKL